MKVTYGAGAEAAMEAAAARFDAAAAENADRARRAEVHMDSAIASLGRAAEAHDRFIARQAELWAKGTK